MSAQPFLDGADDDVHAPLVPSFGNLPPPHGEANLNGCERCMTRWFTPRRAVFCFTIVCLINYLDRGIISGAATEIKGCLSNISQCDPQPGHNFPQLDCDYHCRVCGPCNITQTGFGINTFQLGFLQSSFMVGYGIASITYSKLVKTYRPFRIISVALCLWIVAVLLSGFSNVVCGGEDSLSRPPGELCGGFYLGIFARALSGVGEAATATIAIVYLDDVLEAKSKGFYISIYYSAIPAGTAIGFVYAGQIAALTGGLWQWAFWLEAPLMITFAIGAWFIPYRFKNEERRVAEQHHAKTVRSVHVNSQPSMVESPASTNFVVPHEESLWQELWACLSSPIYMLTAFGYASYTGVVAGFAFYGPQYIQTRGHMFPPGSAGAKSWDISESTADLIFGGIVAFTGFVGTAIGGALLDRFSTGAEGVGRLVPALGQIALFVLVGTAITVFSSFVDTSTGFFVTLAFGVTVMFMTTAGTNIALMWSVPSQNRPMAMALSVIIIHALGDVPSPIIIGAMADKLNPQLTFFITSVWLSWAILCWGGGWLLSKRHVRKLSDELGEELRTPRLSADVYRRSPDSYARDPLIVEESDSGGSGSGGSERSSGGLS